MGSNLLILSLSHSSGESVIIYTFVTCVCVCVCTHSPYPGPARAVLLRLYCGYDSPEDLAHPQVLMWYVWGKA